MNRRAILFAALACLKAPGASRTVKIADFTPSGQKKGVSELDRMYKTDAEWQKQLTPEQFYVTRKKGTERAFTGKYWDNHEDGLYKCICCGTVLFDSKTKFE